MCALLRDLGPLPLLIADMGAGFAWLSHRLATLGHRVVAVDLSSDADFGLGASRLYPAVSDPTGSQLPEGHFWPVLGEMEHPPLRAGLYDAVICNASLHYANDLGLAVRRLAAALQPDGALIVMDSPIASIPRAGERAGSRVLGRAELADALETAGLTTTWVPIRRGWRWIYQQLKNRLRGRTVFEFPLVVARGGPVASPKGIRGLRARHPGA